MIPETELLVTALVWRGAWVTVSTSTSKEVSTTPPIKADIQTSSILNNSSESLPINDIPEWVRGIFYFWVENQISDYELKEAIKFLVNSGIIVL